MPDLEPEQKRAITLTLSEDDAERLIKTLKPCHWDRCEVVECRVSRELKTQLKGEDTHA